RSFELAPPGDVPQHEEYLLCSARWLGAQKRLGPGGDGGIRFAVYAPHARAVEVRMATLTRLCDGASLVTPEVAGSDERATRSTVRGVIGGGHVADDDSGAHPAWGPFPLRRRADGVWESDPDDPRLARFALFDHAPYMFRVTRDDGSIVYRTDLYSRCQIGYG